MKLTDIMKKRTMFSFEVFPPKTDEAMVKLGKTLEHLYEFKPDYISCTYGAGGSNVGRNLEVCKKIKEADNDTIPVTHFTCVGNTKEGVKEQLQNYLDNGINHMLALRGDLPYGWTGTNGDFAYATDLLAYVRKEFGDQFEIAVSGSPEGHITCGTLEADIAHLKQKQDEGADYIMTQLTYDMEQFKYWFDTIRKAGITLPVDVGVMPVVNKDSVINMCLSRNGSAIPRKLAEIISHHWFDKDPDGNPLPEVKEAFREEGINYTVNQLHEYMAIGVDGIHLYAMNTWKNSTEILNRAGIRTLVN
ncbi:methylenetetrahydrofolate reductase [Blautia liquoris]|jgi:methylenetetrahydrofolate reductase (NADPH)|uniref:Methylenetetrahydrofolate reductase n=1 Tax=Blautia liquoris TaxID=2779518 RepID=A0A7M2RKG4_9FIRM|nr:methylenetetrahydrofolate reductase [Blautia liquoris]QOV20484.1 methylenetetrahydrofolate reductase [Blautia liquoris]